MATKNDSLRFKVSFLFLLMKKIMKIIIMIMFIHPAIDTKDTVMWQATVATGNAVDAGTNGSIYLKFQGTANSSDVNLWSMNGILFQSGQVDVFTIYTDYIGQLLQLEIIHVDFSPSYTYQRWYINYIILLDLNTSTEYTFHYSKYIPENTHHFGEVTLRPDTIHHLANGTGISSINPSSLFSTQSLYDFHSSNLFSEKSNLVFSKIKTSDYFVSGMITSGSSYFYSQQLSEFSLLQKVESMASSVKSSYPTNQKAFSSFIDPSLVKDISTAYVLYPSGETSFISDSSTFFPATKNFIDSKNGKISTDIFDTSDFFISNQVSILSSCNCLTSESSSIESGSLSRMASISRELGVDKKNLSIYKRKKMSIPDNRNSAKAIGFIAILVLSLPVVFVILVDISNYRNLRPENQTKKPQKKHQIEKI